MRAYKILPKSVFLTQSSSLSGDALRRLGWMDWYHTHGKNAEGTCRHFSLSKSVFYRWLNRFNKYNLKSLEFDSRTRRPHNTRAMTTPKEVLALIYQIRKGDLEKSKYEIQEELKREGVRVGQTAIQKVINRNPELHNTQHRKRVRSHRKRSIARLKAEVILREKGLGSLVQVDTKYLYVLGRKFYLFSAIDCKSRYGFVRCYRTISSLSAQDFIRRVKEYFPFPISAINTDNGSEYLLNFHKEISSWDIPHFFTDPHCPKQNGRAERFHQTAEYEYFNYQDDLLDDLDLLNYHCGEFNTKYNTQRFHRALGYKTPQECVLLLLNQKGGQPFSI